MMLDNDQPEYGEDVAIFAHGQSRTVVSAFTDVRFRTVTANRAAPLLFGIVLLCTVAFYFVVAGFAFWLNPALGVLWVLLVGPVLCAGVVLVFRILLELILTVMMLMEQFFETSEIVADIGELVAGISLRAEVIPTLPSFVRSVSRRRTNSALARDRARRAAQQAASDGVSDGGYSDPYS